MRKPFGTQDLGIDEKACQFRGGESPLAKLHAHVSSQTLIQSNAVTELVPERN